MSLEYFSLINSTIHCGTIYNHNIYIQHGVKKERKIDMRTVLLLLLPLVFIIGVTYGQGYEDLTKAKDVEPLEYASGAASNIRSITQSYMYNLMKKQSLTGTLHDLSTYFPYILM